MTTWAANDETSVGLQVTCPDGVCVKDVSGCTDSSANNYNSEATVDDGSCEYTPPIINVEVSGCTDTEAINYNSKATINDGSCRYAPPSNVSNFTAVYDSSEKRVALSWQNPADFSVIRIVKLVGRVPIEPDDGTLVYEGRGESARDAAVEEGTTVFYTAFVKNNRGAYSSGAVASAVITSEKNDDEEDGDDGAFTGGDPFSFLPVSTSSVFWVNEQAGWLIKFIQPAVGEKSFDVNMRVSIHGNRQLVIEMNFNALPKVLKTIGVTIADPDDSAKTFSFLLRADESEPVYRATIEPLPKEGIYPIYIYLIDYKNQTIERIQGELLVAGAAGAADNPFAAFVSEVAAPAAAAAGIAFGLWPTISDFFSYIIRFFGFAFGRRRRGKPWGTVYDSVTKRPLDPAYVAVEQKGKEVTGAITDIDGRFGFLLPPGAYILKANKTHYKFPSDNLAGRTGDELYDNLYFGGQVDTAGEEVLNLNIPMDPLEFDWNEFAKTKTDFFRFYSKRELVKNRLYSFFFKLGFVSATLIMLATPSKLNLFLFALYVALYLVNTYWRSRYRPHTVSRGGEPLSFAIIRLYLAGGEQQIKNVVADQYGRFYVLVRPGKYYYTVEEKIADGSYLKIYQSDPIELKRGVFGKDIVVGG